MEQIITKKFTNELEKIFYKDIKDQDVLIDRLYDKYSKKNLKKENKDELDYIHHMYIQGLCMDMVEFPLIEFTEDNDVLIPGSLGEDFNIHRAECIKEIQDKINILDLDVDVNEFPVSLINLLRKFDYPLIKEGMIEEVGSLCNSLLSTIKEYCKDMEYYGEYLFITRFIKTIIDLSKETYDTIGDESYLYDVLCNFYWLLNAVYTNMVLASKDYLDYEVIQKDIVKN